MFSHENAEITEGAENAEGQALDKPVYLYSLTSGRIAALLKASE